MSEYSVSLVEWADEEPALTAIRDQVFIVEQQVPEALERDPADANYIHAIARNADGEAIATGRLLTDGKIGRMAVLKSYRSLGIGRALLERLVDAAQERGDDSVYLEAQVHAISFYETNAFVAEGPEFMDAGIPHRLMRRDLNGRDPAV